VIVLSGVVLGMVDALAPLEQAGALNFLLLVLVWFGYFVLLKGSRYRTLGYVVAGTRIVNLGGDRAGYGNLTMRLLFVIGGPMNALFDIFWLTGDKDRQALRDKFAATYVVRQGAVPAGQGPIRVRTYTFWGMTFLFREVARPAR
jgi:uncharacterized RDD family membrane protein YckC